MALAQLQADYLAFFGQAGPGATMESKLIGHYSRVGFVQAGAPVEAPYIITSIPGDGVTLTLPGEYSLGQCIEWTASDSSAVAVTIASSNITLDMGGYGIQCLAGGIGVRAEAVNAIVVKNGKIIGPEDNGVLLIDGTGLYVEQVKVCHLMSTSLTANPAGIKVVAGVGVEVRDCEVIRSCFDGAGGFGIELVGCPASLVANCRVNRLTNRFGACVGIGHLFCAGLEIRESTITNLRTLPGTNLDAVGHTCIGILPTYCALIEIRDCTIRHVAGSCDDAHGISVFICDDALVERCLAERISTGENGACQSAKTTGIEIYCNQAVVQNCTARRITAKCPGDRQCSGFSVAQATDVTFRCCLADYVRVTNLRGEESVCRFGYGTGFGWAPDPRTTFIGPAVDVLYENCTAKYCQVGFDTWYHQTSTWTCPRSYYNDRAVWNCPGRTRRLSCNRCSECPSPINRTLTDVAFGNTIRRLKKKCLLC